MDSTASSGRRRHIGIVTKAKDEESLAATEGAEVDCLGGVLDHDEPPDGEGEGEEGGDGVNHHGEAGVEQHEDAPGQGVLAK